MNKKIIIIYILFCLFHKDSLENNFYQNIKYSTNPNSNLTLINKNIRLSSDYIPSDLTILPLDVSNSNKYLKKEAAINFILLSRTAKLENYSIIAVSTYRDYKYQEKLYNYYLNNKGIIYADNCSARPGHSEHQTGLAVDVMGSNLDYNNFVETEEFNWMKNNAHKYGFILRYPKDKENITGFKYEPWHYRYVGIDIATYIYENDLTLEEFINKKNNIEKK